MRQTGHFTVGARNLGPGDHVAYVGKGMADFSRLAVHVVAEAAADERVVVCADADWEAAGALGSEIDSGRLLLLPVEGIYDAVLSGVPGSAAAQLREFDTVVQDSVQAGYSAVRVVADNTALLNGSADAVDRWLVWEQVTDRWQATQPVTGICYFAEDQVPDEALAAVARRHPIIGGLGDEPTWFVHHDLYDGVIGPALVGAVEAFDAEELARVMQTEFTLDAAGPGVRPWSTCRASPTCTTGPSRRSAPPRCAPRAARPAWRTPRAASRGSATC